MPPRDPAAPSQQCADPVPRVTIARGGLVYVCDRTEVFEEDGTVFATEVDTGNFALPKRMP